MPIAPGPCPEARPPIIVGGVGEKFTLPLVARYADIWNVPTYALGRPRTQAVGAAIPTVSDIGRDPASIVLSMEAVMALAPDEASLPKVREVAERRFGGTGFGLHEGGLIGIPQVIVDRLRELQELGFRQIVLFTARPGVRPDARAIRVDSARRAERVAARGASSNDDGGRRLW